MSETIIDIRDVTKVFHLGDVDVHALRGVSLKAERGEFLAIMGASGSGKSTLMNILGCLDQPTTGQYFLEGIDIASLDEPALANIRSRRIGFVFQNFNLLARTTALENVALPTLYSGQPGDHLQRVRDALETVGLAQREQNYPSQLSGGQQQRVALARALINDPAILLADEPTGNLDSQTTIEIMNMLRTFNREHGLTIVLVTHEPSVAEFADRLIVMRDGLITSDDRHVSAPAEPTPPDAPRAEPLSPQATAPLGDVWSFGAMALRTAGRAIARNTLRSALTMLGVFIGVAALIAMVAVGQGANAAVKAQIESLGTNLLVVLPGATTASGVRAGLGSASTLTVNDAAAIKTEDRAVADVAYVARQVTQVQNGNENWSTSVQGVTPSYLAIRNWPVVEGRSMSANDLQNAARVGVIGQTVLRNLFGEHANPVGATILVKNVPIEIIGVLATKGQSGFGQDQDDVVLIPFTTAERKVLGVTTPTQAPASTTATIYPPAPNPFGVPPKLTGYVNNIFIQATSAEAVPVALNQVTETLRRQHRIQPGQIDDFGVRNMNDITQAAEGSSRIMALLLATVASISLLVGGIGIMNILIVSVTERTREIGIRLAIGARRTHVLLQFLIEAVLLSVGGGVAGILIGVAASKVISLVAGWPIKLSPAAIIIAFFFSAAVGAFFGYHPARQASRLNPIEALRYE